MRSNLEKLSYDIEVTRFLCLERWD